MLFVGEVFVIIFDVNHFLKQFKWIYLTLPVHLHGLIRGSFPSKLPSQKHILHLNNLNFCFSFIFFNFKYKNFSLLLTDSVKSLFLFLLSFLVFSLFVF